MAPIVVNLNGELWPTPLPLIYQAEHGEFGRFIAHVSIQNDMWKAGPDQDVLAIIQGPSTYITPNWYATKRETHKVVPTWNYAAVHVWGKMTVHHDEKFKRMARGITDPKSMNPPTSSRGRWVMRLKTTWPTNWMALLA